MSAPSQPALSGRCWRRVLCGLLLAGRLAAADLPVITDPSYIWAMPTEEKSLRHPLRIEGRVNYFEGLFKLFWLERDGVSTYVQVSATPPPLRSGQYVVIEGTIVPNQGLDAADARVTVVRDPDPVTPLDPRGRINDQAAFAGRIVTVEGYVDSQQNIDAEHERLILIAENRPLICWVHLDGTTPVPDWRGRRIRVTGLYSARFDPTKTRMTIELWVAAVRDVGAIGTLADSPLFQRPVTPIGDIHRFPAGTDLLIRGRVERQDPGERLVVRDPTGDVRVRSIQTQRVEPGAEVEIAGRVAEVDGWILTGALYRVVAPPAPEAGPAGTGPITRVADIRALGRAEAAAARAVDITGMVTWSLPESDILFFQDPSGGLRVRYDRAKTGNIAYGKYFNLKGVTRAGEVSPEVELTTYVDLGSMSHPRAQPITMEQAATGRFDGEWVELRGFLQRTESEGDWRWIHVMTPTGAFVGHLQSPVNFVANPGALISVRGVCDVHTDAGGRTTGVTLRVPFLHDISIESDAPADYYDLPRRAVADLDSASAGGDLLRVRVAGVLIHAVPGQQLYLQDGDRGVQVLTTETTPLQPGDNVEAVGILGREGGRTLLRAAVYRRIGAGSVPAPRVIQDPGVIDPADDFRLVKIRGTLLDVLNQGSRRRLTLEGASTLFEARLERPGDGPAPKIGAELELTGIYRVLQDEARQPRGFELLVRSGADIHVLQPPPLLDLERLLYVTAALAGCVILGLAWIRSLRRLVRAQTAQIRAQLEQQARVEAGMQQAARLESLGVLAGRIAHDFNNLITVILGNLSLMKLDARGPSSSDRSITDIERAALRGRDLARQLLTFASGGEPIRESVEAAAIVAAAGQQALRSGAVRLEQTAPPDLWRVNGDREQLVQAIHNLLQNAAEAMPRGGTVRVTLANESASGGPQVRITVQDEGGGIPPELLAKVFDPYFTTRKGALGLGLSTVYSIVKRHGGRVEVDSRPGGGATFRLWLPAAAEKPASAAPVTPEPAAIPATGRPRVLLMDDEEDVAAIVAEVLRRLGLDVVTTAEGAAAVREVASARSGGRPFALLILDLTVPGGMGGKEAIQAIRQIDPKVPAIVSSGYSADPVMANYHAHGFQAVVPKPYDLATFAAVVRRFIPQAGSL